MNTPRSQRSLARYEWSVWHIAGAALMAAIGVYFTRDAWRDILSIAKLDEEQSQIWLVLPVAAWLVFVRRSRFRKCEPAGTLLGPFFVLLGWSLSWYGYHRSMQAVWHLGAVLIPLGAMLSVIGKDLFRRFFPAFLVLVFLIPVPGRIHDAIAVPMMQTTARVTEEVSGILGIQVERNGNQLLINDIPINVVEACTGLRMVFSLLMVSYAFAYGELLRNYVRIIILLASPLSAIVCNVIRVVTTVWIYGYGDTVAAPMGLNAMTLGQKFHDIAGYVMLGVAFVLLMGIIRALRWAYVPVQHYPLASQ